jgi:hypothetical protein
VFRIDEVVMSSEREEHIWTKHHVTPDEVEEVCYSDPWVLRGRDGSSAVYGRTEAGRYLAVFLYPRGSGVFSLATAREMTRTERQRFQRARQR